MAEKAEYPPLVPVTDNLGAAGPGSPIRLGGKNKEVMKK
jgi:hypothetical protein